MASALQTLFKKSSTGAILQWRIWVYDTATCAHIITEHGQLGGKLQTSCDVIKEGKNKGRSNSTTWSQQADLEALASWEKQLKKGYVKTAEAAAAGEVDDVIEGGVFPMLAHKFSEQGHKIVYPAFAQPKFDGHRCTALIENGKVTLWSRTRKQITGLPHIVKDLERMANAARLEGVVLDGELYNHDYRSNFEELTSFIRTPEAKEGHEVVQYHVYDIADPTLIQGQRFAIIDRAKEFFRPSTVAVETISVSSEDDLMLAFESFLERGYEGCMVRNSTGKYMNKRSYDLQKVKEFDDAEYQVVGVEEGRGKLAGHAIFVCKTEGGAEFRVKMKGDSAALKTYFESPDTCVGRMLTVKYQGITNKTQVPRFPVGIRFREDGT